MGNGNVSSGLRARASSGGQVEGKSGHFSFRFSPLFSKVDATLPSRVLSEFHRTVIDGKEE